MPMLSIAENGSIGLRHLAEEVFDYILRRVGMTSDQFASLAGTTSILRMLDTPNAFDDGKFLRSTATGTEWADAMTGLGSPDLLTMWTGTTTIGTSALHHDGLNFSINTALSATAVFDIHSLTATERAMRLRNAHGSSTLPTLELIHDGAGGHGLLVTKNAAGTGALIHHNGSSGTALVLTVANAGVIGQSITMPPGSAAAGLLLVHNGTGTGANISGKGDYVMVISPFGATTVGLLLQNYTGSTVDLMELTCLGTKRALFIHRGRIDATRPIVDVLNSASDGQPTINAANLGDGPGVRTDTIEISGGAFEGAVLQSLDVHGRAVWSTINIDPGCMAFAWIDNRAQVIPLGPFANKRLDLDTMVVCNSQVVRDIPNGQVWEFQPRITPQFTSSAAAIWQINVHVFFTVAATWPGSAIRLELIIDDGTTTTAYPIDEDHWPATGAVQSGYLGNSIGLPVDNVADNVWIRITRGGGGVVSQITTSHIWIDGHYARTQFCGDCVA